MTSPLLYGINPTLTLRNGMPRQARYRHPLATTGGVARPFLFGRNPTVTMLLGMGQPRYKPVDPDIKARAILQLPDPALSGSSNQAAVIAGRLVMVPGDAYVVWEVQLSNQMAPGEHLEPLGTTPTIIATTSKWQRSDVTAALMQGLTVTDDDRVRVAMGNAVAGTLFYSLSLTVLDNQGAVRVVQVGPIACHAIPGVTN